MVSLFELYSQPSILFSLIFLITIWSLIWKGLALWRAAQRKQLAWFVVMLIINSAGLIPILYLLITMRSNGKAKPVKIVETRTLSTEPKKSAVKPKKKAAVKKSSKKSLRKKKAVKKKK